MHRKPALRPTVAIALALAGGTAASAAAQDRVERAADGLMNEREEIRLALSAAPPHLHAGAAVLVLGREGYRAGRDGTNGFTCIVERSFDPSVRAPMCLDAIASEYVLPVKLEETRLRLMGHTPEEIEATIADGFASGRFRPPTEPAFSYMLSAGQFLGENVGQWKPHVMVYTPYRTNRELGGDPRAPEFPFIAFEEGKPLSLTVIVTTAFVDPADVEVDW